MATWWRAALILAAGALTYANSVSAPFMFDDRSAIVDNTHIRDLRPSTALFAERESPTAGRPLVNLSFAANYAAGGLDPTGYRVTNIAIHLLAALVLFGLVRRTLDLPGIPDTVRQRTLDIALAIALLWTLHPLNSEAVDYVTQRTESLMAVFYLLTMYCAVRSASAPDDQTRRWSAAAVVCCALGMACKESMVTAPIAVLLYDRVFLGADVRRSRARWLLYGGLAATWTVLGALVWPGPRAHSAGFTSGVSPLTYALNQAAIIVHYLRLALWPHPLIVAYGEPLPTSFGSVLPQLLVVAALLSLTIVALWRWPLLGFLGAWFFVTLAPTSSIVPIATEVGAERRMYLPLIAIVALAAVALTRLRRAAAIGVTIALAAALAATTVIRNREYGSPLGMAETVLARRPTDFSRALVGLELAQAGRHDDAIRQLRDGARTYTRARYHLGGELFNTGRREEALTELQQFVRDQPQLAEAVPARTMIGRIYLDQKKTREAIDQFQLVRSMTSSSSDAHTTATGFLADALFMEDRLEDSMRLYREFAARRPSDVGALVNLGIGLARTGQTNEAINVFRRAIAANPKDVMPRRNLVNALLNTRQLQAAADESLALIKVRPTDAVGHDLRGRALAEQGRFDEAGKEFDLAVQLDPDNAQAREDQALLKRVSGVKNQ